MLVDGDRDDVHDRDQGDEAGPFGCELGAFEEEVGDGHFRSMVGVDVLFLDAWGGE